jgi:hypothetical protein
MSEIDKINVCIPVLSAIIERDHNSETEILVQTRWNANINFIYFTHSIN